MDTASAAAVALKPLQRIAFRDGGTIDVVPAEEMVRRGMPAGRRTAEGNR